MQGLLLRTLSWLSGDSATSPTAAGVLAAPSDTMPSSRLTRSVKQATLRLSELHHAAAHNKPLWRSSVRQHASSVAQDIIMAAWRLDHVANSGRSAGSTVRHDAKLTADTLSHAGNAESERAAARNKPARGASLYEAACKLCCSGRWHGCLATRPRHQQWQECWQHCQTRCQALASHAQPSRQP